MIHVPSSPAGEDPAPRHRPIHRLGDRSVLVDCADLAEVMALHAHLEGEPLLGQAGLIPAASTLLIRFHRPLEALRWAEVSGLLAAATASVQTPTGASGTGSAATTGPDEATGDFDSLLAKLVVTAPTREQTIARAREALCEMAVHGVATTLPFHRAVLERPEFAAPGGEEDFRVHTTWIEESLAQDLEPEGGYAAPRYADPDAYGEGIGADGGAEPTDGDAPPAVTVTAPLAGSLVRWTAEDGATVTVGQRLAVLEAMKTEMPLESPATGTFHPANLEPGARISSDEVLGRVDPA